MPRARRSTLGSYGFLAPSKRWQTPSRGAPMPTRLGGERKILTQTTPMAAVFVSMIAACGGRRNPSMQHAADQLAVPPSDAVAGGGPPGNLTFVSVLEGGWQCGLEADKSIVCKGPPPRNCGNRFHDDGAGNCVANYVLVSTSGWHVCGVLSDNSVICWQADRRGDRKLSTKDQGQANPPAGSFIAVSAAESHVCGVRTDGAVACWGATNAAAAKPPVGPFTSVSTAPWHTCGVRLDDTVACWGARPGVSKWSPVKPPARRFDSVSTGEQHTCGVTTDNTIVCWGNNRYGQAKPPAGWFTSVSAGRYHTCGVRTDGTIACWGRNRFGEATPASGVFTSVAAGDGHTCGVRLDGTLACWGRNDHGQATPPPGIFSSISAGGCSTCGVWRVGNVACWGTDGDNLPMPPAEARAAERRALARRQAFIRGLPPELHDALER